MSQVHNVTHVTVHSPLSGCCFCGCCCFSKVGCARAHRLFRAGVAGRNGPAEVGGGRRTAPEAREEPSSPQLGPTFAYCSLLCFKVRDSIRERTTSAFH